MKRGEICNEYTREEFLGLDPKELKKMGLRALNPFDLMPEKTPEANEKSLQIDNFGFHMKTGISDCKHTGFNIAAGRNHWNHW